MTDELRTMIGDDDLRRAKSLLRASLGSGLGFVDRLLDRTGREGNRTWILRDIDALVLAGTGHDHRVLSDPSAPLATLQVIKEAAKRRMRAERGSMERTIGLVTYYLAVAAAAQRFGELISSQKTSDLLPALRELAHALPAPLDRLAAGGLGPLER